MWSRQPGTEARAREARIFGKIAQTPPKGTDRDLSSVYADYAMIQFQYLKIFPCVEHEVEAMLL